METSFSHVLAPAGIIFVMTQYLILEPITKARLKEIADERFGDLVKGVVDVEKHLLILGAELHIDGATELQNTEGSKGESLWGINLYPGEDGASLVEFDSVINLKPALGNRTRSVEDPALQERILAVVREKITDSGL
jgi:hypothetical protein